MAHQWVFVGAVDYDGDGPSVDVLARADSLDDLLADPSYDPDNAQGLAREALGPETQRLEITNSKTGDAEPAVACPIEG